MSPIFVDLRTCYDIDPAKTFTVVDLCDGPGLQPYSVLFDDLNVFDQCRMLDAWYCENYDGIAEIPF